MPRNKARAGAGSPEQGESAQATQQKTQADPGSDGEQDGAPSAASPTAERSETEVEGLRKELAEGQELEERVQSN